MFAAGFVERTFMPSKKLGRDSESCRSVSVFYFFDVFDLYFAMKGRYTFVSKINFI